MHLIKKKFKKLKNGIEILVGQAVLSYRSGLGKWMGRLIVIVWCTNYLSIEK